MWMYSIHYSYPNLSTKLKGKIMFKRILLLSCLSILAACSPNYSGTYVSIQPEKKSYRVDANGDRVAGMALFFGSQSGSKLTKKYEYIVNEAVLAIKDESNTLEGGLSIYDGSKLIKFAMESGHIDEMGMMKLRFTKDSGAQAGMALGPFSFSGGVGGVVLEMNQVPSNIESEFMFEMRMNANMPFGMGSRKSKKVEISFTRTGDLTKEKIIKKYTNRLIESEKAIYQEKLAAGKIKAAEIHKDLIVSLDGSIE